MNVEIPDKLYFKIGEVGKLADVPTHVLRYWESEFKGIKPKRASSKQRLYRREDVKLILQIKRLLYEQGYTIAGARKLIQSGEEIPQPVKEKKKKTTKDILEPLSKIKQELLRLQQLLQGKKE